jgi:putative transcriptional regulator
MNEFSRDLLLGMKEAVAFSESQAAGARVQTVEVPDERAIRRQLHMSQHEVADAYRIQLATLKTWEQGRRAPDP